MSRREWQETSLVFAGGPTLTIALDGNFLLLSREEWDFMFSIADAVAAYRAAHPPLREGAPAPGAGQGPDADPNPVGVKL